eukprot:2817361-Ditylum_brightwellii.AAC.1
MDDVAMDIHPEYQMIPHDASEAASILGEVLPLCHSQAMYQLLNKRGNSQTVNLSLQPIVSILWMMLWLISSSVR